MASERDYDRLTTSELFLAAICAGVARWEPFESTKDCGELCMRSMRWSVKLTKSGVPDLDDHPVRRELLIALRKCEVQP